MDIFDQLTRDEGLKLKPYIDTVGKLTIGIGRNLTDKGISEDEANYLLANDVKEVEDGLKAALPWFSGLDDARQGVLINMGFNLGLAGLLQFHNALHWMEASDWGSAAQEILSSRWATQVGARAQRLAEQLQSGTWT